MQLARLAHFHIKTLSVLVSSTRAEEEEDRGAVRPQHLPFIHSGIILFCYSPSSSYLFFLIGKNQEVYYVHSRFIVAVTMYCALHFLMMHSRDKSSAADTQQQRNE